MRKLLSALMVMLLMTGLVVAAEVVVVSYDKDKMEVKVKEGDSEKVYKITDKTKVTLTDKDGNTSEGKVVDLTRRLEKTKAGGKRAMKLDITADGDTITAVKMRAFGKKKD